MQPVLYNVTPHCLYSFGLHSVIFVNTSSQSSLISTKFTVNQLTAICYGMLHKHLIKQGMFLRYCVMKHYLDVAMLILKVLF